MITTIDEGRGFIKVYWEDIAQRVAKVSPELAKIVNALSPDKSYPLYIGYYPYGMYIGDTRTIFIPKVDGGMYRLTDPDVPAEIVKDLGYGMNSAPMALVLEKELEFFLDLKSPARTIPHQIYRPGYLFGVARVLNRKKTRNYAPNGIMSTTSGARSIFMLPHIASASNHLNLQRDFNIQDPPPQSLYDHWPVFCEILGSDNIKCNWQSSVIYFSEKWIEKLTSDKTWLPFKMYLHEFMWSRFEFDRNRILYDSVFSMIQHKRNLKPNPYLADTARHLLAIVSGVAPCYVPATSDDSFPNSIIQHVYTQSYGLKKYLPTIMQPAHFKFESDKHPCYYSLQHPSTQIFSPKSRRMASRLFDIRELRHIMRIFVEELSAKNMFGDTVLHQIAQQTEFKYFHNEYDQHKIVRDSKEILKFDKRFNKISPENKIEGVVFASDARFWRGSISMTVIR